MRRLIAPSFKFGTRRFLRRAAIRSSRLQNADLQPPIGASSTRFKPGERLILFRRLEIPDLRLNQVVGDARHDLEKPAVGDDSDALDLPMVTDDEPEMRRKCSETRPAGERLYADHQAAELALRRDERIDLFRESLEVRFLKRTLRLDDHDATVGQHLNMKHWAAFPSLVAARGRRAAAGPRDHVPGR